MQTRGLGKTGLQVSELCMGCWEIGGLFWGPMDVKDAQRLLRGAYDAGVNAYDLADVYGNGRSECLVGRTLGDRRDELVLVTKAGYLPGADSVQFLYEEQVQCHEPRYLQWCCEMSLRRLETDYVDVFLLHDPPMQTLRRPSVWNALRKLKKEDKVRAIGVSANPDHIPTAIEMGAEVVEFPFNLLTRQAATEVLPLARKRRVGVLARSPFAGGAMLRKYKGAPANAFRFLAKPQRPLTSAAVKYVLTHEEVSAVVAGLMRRSDLNRNVAACKRPLLRKTELKRIAAMQG
ncbi:MAG: aldo/keto reductase [Candidatus Latescibacterota bacterium]|nr:aldo/keto reductase [Candidatus Latescibacterota bacterium]